MPFHAATANMAALLRSARLLKISPSGLLHVTATNRNGPPLGRLYSGALGGSRTGACSRLSSPASEYAPSSVAWPHAVGCVRSYALAAEQKSEVSDVLQTKQTRQFDWALYKLDSSVRRTGRIPETMLLSVFNDICSTGYHSANQALLLLRSCGSLLPEMHLEERTVLAHRMWAKFQELGIKLDVSHYNALIKVYLQNEFKFSPTDFLAKMESANVYPNRVTYQRLIAAYCQNGDIDGASTILGFMKSKGLPITEAVFNSLVTGHARADDIESAASVLSVMKGAGIEPGPDTYLSLLTAFAEKGDLDSLEKTMEEAESADCGLMDRDIMQVIYTLARAEHQQHIPKMIERLKFEKRFLPDAMNVCLRLVTQGEADAAFDVLKSFPSFESSSPKSDSPHLGSFFLRHCVNQNTAVEKIGRYCKELQESNRHSDPLIFSLGCSLEAKNIGMSLELMKMLKEQGLPIKPHYFSPLLCQNVMDKNSAGVLELVKKMQELSVSPDADTYAKFILPAFPSMEEARQALMNAGIPIDSEDFGAVEVHAMAKRDLGKLYTLLSDPSFPSLERNSFRSSIIQGFRKSDDVESMVKITELLFKDERYAQKGPNSAEGASFFFYYLFDNMTETEVQEQKEKLQDYLHQLQTREITIPENICRGIRNILRPYNVPKLIQDVMAMSHIDGASSGSLPPFDKGTEDKVATLERKLATLKAKNKPFTIVLNHTIRALCAEENLPRVLELKQQHEKDIGVNTYASLLYLYCRQGNVEEALNLKRELSCKDSSYVLDANKYITLVRALSEVGRVEEAVDILKEMKEKEVVLNDTHANMIFFTLNSLVDKGGAPTIRRLQDTIFTLGLIKPSANICSPLITAYLESKDMSGALQAAIDIQKLYKYLPRLHNIIVGLVETGDTELLQRAMDYVTQERGEMNMLYDLFFAFLQTGRYREARKIIETQGLRAKPARLQWYAEKCISSNQMECLQQMVDMTATLFECDRDEMYSYILRLCKENNNLEQAEAVWTKMQEENVIPRERTLRLLADIMKNNGQEVPFEVPETWYAQAATTEQEKAAVTPIPAEPDSHYKADLSDLCKQRKAKEAYAMLKEADEKAVTLSTHMYDLTICALLAQGHIEDAMEVKDIALSRVPRFQLSHNATNLQIIAQSKKGQTTDALEMLKSRLQMSHTPSQVAIISLVQALGDHGDIAGIQEVESLTKGLHTTMSVSLFVNNRALGHIKNDDVESAVDELESVYTSPDGHRHSMSIVFKKILNEGNDKALDKLGALAERLANHFARYRPATDLFLQLLDNDKFEDAKFMLARCNAVAEQKARLTSFMSRKSQIPGQVGKVKALLSLIPDFTDKEVSYRYLMKCHVSDEDLASAKALHEQMQKEEVVVSELSLKLLAQLYRKAGETAPFPEPPESFKFYADQLKKQAPKASAAEK